MSVESLESQLNAKLLLNRLNETPPKFHQEVIVSAAERFVHDYDAVLTGFDRVTETLGKDPLVLKEVEDDILGSGRILASVGFERDKKDPTAWEHLRKTGAFVTRFTYENNETTKTLEVRKFKLIPWMLDVPYINLDNAASEWPFNDSMYHRVAGNTSYRASGSPYVKPKHMVLAAEEEHRRNIIEGKETLTTLATRSLFKSIMFRGRV